MPENNRHPELRKLFDALQNEKAKLVERAAPLRKQREELLVKIQPLEAELRAVNEAIQKVEMPRMAELKSQIAGLAKAMGGKTMSGQ